MEKEKEDKAKAKESAACMREVDGTWMVMLDEFDFKTSGEDLPIPGPAHRSMSSLKGLLMIVNFSLELDDENEGDLDDTTIDWKGPDDLEEQSVRFV